MIQKNKVAIVVAPKTSKDWEGAEGVWIMLSGWGKGLKSIFIDSFICTNDGIFSYLDVLNFPIKLDSELKKNSCNNYIDTTENIIVASGRKKRTNFFKIFIKDIYRGVRFFFASPPIFESPLYLEKEIGLVIERHDLFSGWGKKIANFNNVPYVVLVDAPVVWEEKKWGVNRYFWGKFLEFFFEKRTLQSADFIICISQPVKDYLQKIGISPFKISVISNRVDMNLFNSNAILQSTYQLNDIGDEFVVGWVGSFRSFHAVDIIIEAFSQLISMGCICKLVLVGDGSELSFIRALVSKYGLENFVVFTGKIPFNVIPSVISKFSVGVVSARQKDDFHYSPLKLREYLACGTPTVVPDIDSLSQQFNGSNGVVFYETGNSNELANSIYCLYTDRIELKRLRHEALEFSKREAGWEIEVANLILKIESSDNSPNHPTPSA